MISSTRVESPLKELARLGQSVWLDYIRRSLITSGELKRLVDEDGLGGVTSNPAIFEKAITGSDGLRRTLGGTAQRQGSGCEGASMSGWRFAIFRMPPTCCVRFTIARSGRDGYVSLEVSPFLANETQATIEEARRLWKAGGPRRT